MPDRSHNRPAQPKRPTVAHRREYERRVNRVVDYIEAHLSDELPLEKLAAVAAFSPFHFHRVFAAITGETLSDFIRRIRLERAPGGWTRGWPDLSGRIDRLGFPFRLGGVLAE